MKIKDKKLDYLKTFFTLFISVFTFTLFNYCGSSNDDESELNVNEVSTKIQTMNLISIIQKILIPTTIQMGKQILT